MITKWNMFLWEAWLSFYTVMYVVLAICPPDRTGGDVWVNKTKDNYQKLVKAFVQFGMPVFDMTEDAFLGNEFDVWGIGVQPVKIEIMTAVKGLAFEETYRQSQFYNEDGLQIRFIHFDHLLQAEKAAGRFRHLDDIDQLTKK